MNHSLNVRQPAALAVVAALLLLWSRFSAAPATCATASRAGGNFPKQVLIIRHAEKPDAKDDPHLTSRGAARAAALPSLFVAPPTFPTKPASFPNPDFLFATKESSHSSRPVETVTPLSKALDLKLTIISRMTSTMTLPGSFWVTTSTPAKAS